MHGDNTIFAAEIVHALTDLCLKGKGRIEFGETRSPCALSQSSQPVCVCV